MVLTPDRSDQEFVCQCRLLVSVCHVRPTASAGYDAGKKIKGRKRHIATDALGLLLVVVVTAANIQDRDGAHRLLVALRARFSTVSHIWVDGGYAGRLVTWANKVLSATLQVVKRTDKISGFLVLPRRWVVERTFGWITKTPPLRPRLRNPAQPPRSHGLHRHDHDHVPPTRPHRRRVTSVFRRPLRHEQRTCRGSRAD